MATFRRCSIESCRCSWCTPKIWGSKLCSVCKHEITQDVTEKTLTKPKEKEKPKPKPKPKPKEKSKEKPKEKQIKFAPDTDFSAEPKTRPESKSWLTEDALFFECDRAKTCKCDGICIPKVLKEDKCRHCGHPIHRKRAPSMKRPTEPIVPIAPPKPEEPVAPLRTSQNIFTDILADRGLDKEGKPQKKDPRKGKKKKK